MICSNCQKEIEETVNFCPKCGKKIEKDSIQNNTTNSQAEKNDSFQEINPATVEVITDENEKANVLCLISLCLFYMGSFFLSLIPVLGKILTPLSPLAAISIMIYVRIKYPSNTFGKVLMILYIINTILLILGFIFLLFLCNSIARSCN